MHSCACATESESLGNVKFQHSSANLFMWKNSPFLPSNYRALDSLDHKFNFPLIKTLSPLEENNGREQEVNCWCIDKTFVPFCQSFPCSEIRQMQLQSKTQAKPRIPSLQLCSQPLQLLGISWKLSPSPKRPVVVGCINRKNGKAGRSQV